MSQAKGLCAKLFERKFNLRPAYRGALPATQFDDPGAIEVHYTDLPNMIVNGFAAFAGLLGAKGVASLDEVASALSKFESDDPAVRWVFDRVASELKSWTLPSFA